MNEKRKTIEVFTVPRDELITKWMLHDRWRGGNGWHPLLGEGKIREVELIHNDVEGLSDTEKSWLTEVGCDSLNDEIRFTVCSPEVQSTELQILRTKQAKIIEKHRARARSGEIDYMEASELTTAEMDSLGIKDFHIELDNNILALMCEKRGLYIGQITKVELTDDGVEFTMVRV